MATANGSRSRSGGGKNSTTYKKGQGRANQKKKKKSQNRPADPRKNEIYLFVYLAVAVFLLCSNFGWCGVVGDFFARIFFGLFGSVAYILPVYLFFSAAFLLSNGAQKTIVKRVLCVGIFLVVVAFICQMITGADDMTVKILYQNGAADKRGGGVILGGILVLLYKLIGLTGSVIVTILLTVIGIIIVLDVSIIDLVKESFYREPDDDEDYSEDFDFEEKQPVKGQNKDVLNSIKVLEPEGKKKSKRTKNKIVHDEEVHELKPLPASDILLEDAQNQSEFDKNGRSMSEDFFNKPEFVQRELQNADQTSMSGIPEDIQSGENVTELAPVKRRRKKTKESNAEMLEARDDITREINMTSEASASGMDTQHKQETKMSVKEMPLSDSEIEIKDDTIVREYQFPPIELLKKAKSSSGNGNENSVRETAMKLKSTLENFGVNVTITNYSCGPSVTRYELQPEQGVKVSKIVNLADDIKLNLAAADIRIEAPIPGKAAIGIEVPNKESQAVYFRDLLESDNFKKFPSNIAFAVGKDISGQVIVADIAKMPHLLVAGATGSGKSVCINTLIMSILYKAKPDDVKLIMVDPKQVELSIYNGIPHMLIPVVTDPKKAAGALNWAVMEMTNRYQLFAQYNVRNLQGYNEKVKTVTGTEEGNDELKKLPQIVIIVDELADLMMVAHGEVEDAIVRLSQLARAAGIHLIIATQRPSVDVITGLIKANVPSRIAMTVSSGVDSRTILDMNGAEKLLGKGDMLFYPTGYPKPVRVQGAFLSDDEIAGVVDFLKAQNGEGTYDEKISQEIASTKVGSSGGSASSEPEYDDYFVDAGKFIIGKDKASIGMLQRVYKIGFNRAARIMDQLSDAGVVGPEEGTKPRKVLMTMEEFENYVEEYL